MKSNSSACPAVACSTCGMVRYTPAATNPKIKTAPMKREVVFI